MEASDAFMFAGHKQVHHSVTKQINIPRIEVVTVTVLLKTEVGAVQAGKQSSSVGLFDPEDEGIMILKYLQLFTNQHSTTSQIT